jgi:pimeloyl-ACP methyl ester carboxylesterase
MVSSYSSMSTEPADARHGVPGEPMTMTLAGHGAIDAAAPIVFTHGVFMDHTMWDPVRDALDVSSLALDMPGHGASPPVAATTLDDHVAAVAASLERAGASGCVVVGHSWGGMTALRLAIRRPDLVAGLVLCNTPLRRTSGVSRLGFIAQRLAVSAHVAPLPFFAAQAAKSLFDADVLAARPELVTAMQTRLSAMGRHNLSDTLRSVLLEPDDALGLLDQLNVPWRFVAGRDDYVLSGGVAVRLERTAQLVRVPGGHMTPLEQPDAVVNAIGQVRTAVDRG